MSEIQDKESIQILDESLKKAMSLAYKLGFKTKSRYWTLLGDGLDQTRQRANEIYRSPPPDRQTTLAMIDHLVDVQAVSPGSESKQ